MAKTIDKPAVKPSRKPVADAVNKALEQKKAGEMLADMTKGAHTWNSGEGSQSYTYTDADVKLAQTAFGALKAVDKAIEAFAPAAVRIFGDKWTTEGATAEDRKPLRLWLRDVLPEAQALAVKRARYAAAAKVGGVNADEARLIRMESKDVEAKISRIISGAAKAWQDHVAAQADDFQPERNSKKTRTADVILDDAVAALDKRGQKQTDDAATARRYAGVIGQVRKGRLPLFEASMKFGARNKLSDTQVIAFLQCVSDAAIRDALAAAEKATADQK